MIYALCTRVLTKFDFDTLILIYDFHFMNPIIETIPANIHLG